MMHDRTQSEIEEMETAEELRRDDLNKPHPNTIKRSKQEIRGGWLPLFIEAEPCVITHATIRCFYCGFGFGEGHDDACRYLGSDVPELGEGKDRVLLIPVGGLPPSNSFF